MFASEPRGHFTFLLGDDVSFELVRLKYQNVYTANIIIMPLNMSDDSFDNFSIILASNQVCPLSQISLIKTWTVV